MRLRGVGHGTAIVVLMAAVASAVAAPAAPAPGSCAAPPAFRPGPLGAVAYLLRRTVHVVDLSSGSDRALRVLPGPRPLSAGLAWSPDGRWITVGNDLVAASTGAICRPFGADYSSPQWRPRSDEVLAVSRRGQTVIGVPGGTPRRLLPSGFAVAAGAFAPDGDRLVAEGQLASLWVVDVSTGHRRRVWRSPAPYGSVGPPFPGTWSPDGRWVLFHTDSGHSASIAADGTPLWAVPAAGGPAVRVEPTVLDNADFVQQCGPSAIVVSAGEDRYVSHDKRVDVAAPATWKPHTISDDPGRSWYAAACSPDGALVAATVTANAPEAMFDTAQRSIWLLSTRGGAHRLLVRPATGISVEEPRFANDGNWILYLQHPARPYPVARLYLVNVHTGARRGPYGQIAGGLGYYGQHGWDDLAPWYQPAA